MDNKNRFKFRIWDKTKKKLSPVLRINYADDGFTETILIEPAPKHNYFYGVIHSENGVLSQFTGLQDINKKDIYEYDIVKYYLSDFRGKLSKEERGEIKYDMDAARFYIYFANNDFRPEKYNFKDVCEIEVIGNSFQGVLDMDNKENLKTVNIKVEYKDGKLGKVIEGMK